MRRMKLSLKARLVISYGLISLFLIGSLLMISNYVLEHHFQSYIELKQEHTNQNLVAAVLDEFMINEQPSQEAFRQIGKNALENGIILMVHNTDEEQLYCEECSNGTDCNLMYDMMKTTMQKRYPNWEGEYVEKKYPLIREGKEFGYVTLGYYGPFFFSEEDLYFVSMLNNIFLISAITFLVIAIAFGIFLASRIAKPIKYVIDRTYAMEHNQYAGRIEFESNTIEIDQLIDSINTLADTLEKQQKIKRRMANDYAHEFRTPLAALQSNLEGMIDGIFSPTPERLESCHAEILRLSRMISEIDRLVELDNKNLILNKEWFDFGELANTIAISFQKEMFEKDIKLITDISSCKLYAEKDKISQVMVNLVSNAVKYTGIGGEVKILAKQNDDATLFIVEDTGYGIAKVDLPNIFEYLYRVDSSRSRDTGGTGIGLSIVKAIIDAHDGKIEVESEEGKGSKFTILIYN